MLDFKTIEQKWEQSWQADKIFEVKKENKPKFFMTVPYPYISGSLHIGHARVVTEADVFSRYQRMKGLNVLFPLAFHISGTPVLGISLAIQNNDSEKINTYKGYVRRYVETDSEAEKIVKTFIDPQKIVEFFIPKMIDEFKQLGISVDYRRSYTSGDIEHQALVEWQFRKYKEKNYLVQGKYPILFSKTLKNAVGEDDISDGDTNPVEINVFTLIKFRFGDSFLVAGTLRPETMFGQTNLWVNPALNYVKAKVGDETWIISRECADKLKYQDKEVKVISEIPGLDLIGKRCFAPFVNRNIIILPSKHCDPLICTGIVTSVPSDAPFDYISLKELQESKKLCLEYKLDYDEIKKIQLIPIIKSKGYGEYPAVEICDRMNIKSLNEKEKLDCATQEIYKIGFHTGIMNNNCAVYSGLSVRDAKEGMKKYLINNGLASEFYETSRTAKSRDGGQVIVAILDNQWFLDFNAKGWKTISKKCLESIEIWPDKYRKQFLDVFDWLDKRPCARMRGLGTKLPFDNKWVIESLSDSTVYMSLYPIIHIIRENKLKKEQLTDAFFDYVFNEEGNLDAISKSLKIPKLILLKLREEWSYWYPFDQRHTFSAHLSNHLSFMIFAHTALFTEQFWPKRISFHGMIISEGEKMSKSKGNVITLLDIKDKFGADPFRAFMCSSTSVESTFNWETDKVSVMQKHLINLFEVISEIQNNKVKNKDYLKFSSFVSKTERAIKDSTEALDRMDLREYSNIVLYEMLNNYKRVKRLATDKEVKSLNYYIGDKWTLLLSPLVPHISEELYSLNPKNKGYSSVQDWPKYDAKLINDSAEYQDEALDSIRTDISAVLNLAKIDKPKEIKLFVSATWKYDFYKMLVQELEKTKNPGEIIKSLMQTNLRKYGTEITKLVPVFIKDQSRLPINLKTQKEELEFLKSILHLLITEFKCEISVLIAEESNEQKAKNASPGKPAILIV